MKRSLWRGARRLLALALLLAVAGYAAAGGFAGSGVSGGRSFDPPAKGRLEPRGALVVRSSDKRFGGFSGLLADGGEILAVSDRGAWGRMSLAIENGRLEAATVISTDEMLDATGKRARGGGWDAEGLARLADGRLLVSLERDHRLQVFDSATARAGPEIRDPAWERFDLNAGLEGLATDGDGRIWAIREGADDAGAHPVYVGALSGPWEVKRLPGRGDYVPTGADFGPDGWLYVTERDFSIVTGFSTRIRRFRWGAGADPTTEETLAEFRSRDGLDNVEGISVWRGEAGEMQILLISDDNFLVFQNTVLSLFALR